MSSYIIFGKCFENNDLAIEKLENYSKLYQEDGIADVRDMEEEELFEVICNILDLDFWQPHDGEIGTFCGILLDEIEIDQTKEEFQDEILKKFQRLFPEMKIEDLHTYEILYGDVE